MLSKCSTLAFVAALCALLGGCGGGPELGTVTGTVTLGGKPLEGALVSFAPQNGRPSSDTTDAAGHYELQYTIDKPGAMIGSHSVSISTSTMREDGTITAERVPAKFNTQSTLKREVKSGENVFDFEIP